MIGCLAGLDGEAGGRQHDQRHRRHQDPDGDDLHRGLRSRCQEVREPGTKTLVDYSQDFVDQAKCKELALNHIDGGSKVEFAVAGHCGLGALDAAKEAKIWGVGVDKDQSFLGPHILTSAVKKVDRRVYRGDQLAEDLGLFKPAGTRPQLQPEEQRVGSPSARSARRCRRRTSRG